MAELTENCLCFPPGIFHADLLISLFVYYFISFVCLLAGMFTDCVHSDWIPLPPMIAQLKEVFGIRRVYVLL